MPDLFRHPPAGRRQARKWTPGQVGGDDLENYSAHSDSDLRRRSKAAFLI